MKRRLQWRGEMKRRVRRPPTTLKEALQRQTIPLQTQHWQIL